MFKCSHILSFALSKFDQIVIYEIKVYNFICNNKIDRKQNDKQYAYNFICIR